MPTLNLAFDRLRRRIDAAVDAFAVEVARLPAPGRRPAKPKKRLVSARSSATWAQSGKCLALESRDLSQSEIASELELDRSSVGNLLRLRHGLHPTILADWKRGNARASLGTLLRLVGQPPGRQIKQWRKLVPPR